MSTHETARRLETLYNNPLSRERRAAEARGPDRSPAAEAKRRHLDERQALGERHRREADALNARLRDERNADDRIRSGAAMPHQMTERHERQRLELRRRHAEQRDALARRHRAELERLYAAEER